MQHLALFESALDGQVEANYSKLPRAVVGKFPATDRIAHDNWEWMAVEFVLSLPSIDFDDEGLSEEENREDKRYDLHYEGLMESLDEKGFYNPVYVGSIESDEEILSDTTGTGLYLGNGHHRVVAMLDLGYDYIPVTRSEDHQWDEDCQDEYYQI